MRDSWLQLVDALLRPARPHLALREREVHLEARRTAAEERQRALTACEAKIESARAAVFTANNGVVPARMRELEKEWVLLARLDPDAGLMNLWARIAPARWLDRKMWRDSEASGRVDAVIALAADPDGVEAAESAVAELRPGARVRWRGLSEDRECTSALFSDRRPGVDEDVLAAVTAKFPDRPLLARDIARAAFVGSTPLLALWKTGYLVSSFDETTITLEFPPI